MRNKLSLLQNLVTLSNMQNFQKRCKDRLALEEVRELYRDFLLYGLDQSLSNYLLHNMWLCMKKISIRGGDAPKFKLKLNWLSSDTLLLTNSPYSLKMKINFSNSA